MSSASCLLYFYGSLGGNCLLEYVKNSNVEFLKVRDVFVDELLVKCSHHQTNHLRRGVWPSCKANRHLKLTTIEHLTTCLDRGRQSQTEERGGKIIWLFLEILITGAVVPSPFFSSISFYYEKVLSLQIHQANMRDNSGEL